MQYTPWTSKEEWNTTASPRAYNAHGSVRTLIIYPASQVCMYCQYKLMACGNCWTKCYSGWITAHRMDTNRKRRSCKKMWTTSNNNPFHNLLKLQAWKKCCLFFSVISLLTEVPILYSRPAFAILKFFWHLSLPSHSNCKQGKTGTPNAPTPSKSTATHLPTCTPLKWALKAKLKI